MKSRRGVRFVVQVASPIKPPVAVPGSIVVAIALAIVWLALGLAARPVAVLGAEPTSKLLAFGFNTYGQLGDGSTTERPLPVEIAGMSDIVAIEAGFEHSLALRSDGRVYAWGRNDRGQLGDGTRTMRTVPTLVPGLTYVTAIGAGGDFSLALRSDGSVWQWGARQTLMSSTSLPDLLVPTPTGITNFAGGSLGAGAGHRLVVSADAVEAWGDNTNGQLANGNTTASWTPAIFFNPWGGARQAEGGFGHTVLRLYDGTLRAIGRNDNGQLGDGSTVERHTLVEVPGITDVAQIAVGDMHTLARTADGRVWSWGDGSTGQLGNGATTDRAVPAAIPALSGVTRIGAGGYSSYAINASGTWFWGGSHGSPMTTPYLLPGTTGATDATGGLVHHLVLLNAVALHLPAASGTTLSVTTSSDPAFVDEPVTLTFTVAPGPDMGTISRSPTALGPFTPIATIDPMTGKAEFESTYTSSGTYPMWYRFDGVPGFDQSAVVYFEQPVSQRATTTTATPASATVGRGDPLTVTASISPIPADAGFAGYALLRDGGIPVTGNKLVDPASGVVTFTIDSLEVGHHDLYVDFAGTNRFAASTSTPMDITIFDRPTTTTAHLTVNPSKWGEPVAVEVGVSPIPDDGGAVRISRDGHALGWATMNWTSGTGTFALDAIEPGDHDVVAEFIGAGYVARWASSSATVNQTVSTTPIDTDPPVGTVTINDGATVTRDGYVVVSIHATDASRISSVGISCDNLTWTSVGTTDGDWGWGFGDPGCSGAQGLQTVYVRFADIYGNTSVASDSIILDQTPPTGSVVIAGGADSVISPSVDVDVTATDALSEISDVALSNDGQTWTWLPYAPSQRWDLTGGEGVRTVFAKWRDSAGNESSPRYDTIVLAPIVPDPIPDPAPVDTVAPTAAAPMQAFVTASSVTSGKPAVKFAWSGTDIGSGIAHYEFALSADGGAFTAVAQALTSPTFSRPLAVGHTYRAAVRAIDIAGNVGAWAYGTGFRLSAYQESSRSIRWSGTWHTSTSTAFWGGHDRYATASGANASLTFSGRSFAWVGSIGPTRGWAKVYVNGVLVRSINLSAARNANQRILYATTWSIARSRTVTIRISGTAGHPRGDVDAFIVGS